MSWARDSTRGQLRARVATYLVREHHQTPVRLPAQNATDALCSVPHCVESKELRLPYPIRVSKVFQACLEDSAFGVLVWDTACFTC